MLGNEAKGGAYGRSLRSNDEGRMEGESGSNDRSHSEGDTEEECGYDGVAGLTRKESERAREKPALTTREEEPRGLQPGMLMSGWRD